MGNLDDRMEGYKSFENDLGYRARIAHGEENWVKSYIIRIELEESNPLIWRKVVMPAGATYKRLHDVIQNVTNFQGGYPSDGYHLYTFDLEEENRVVTNDDEWFLEHQDYRKNKKRYAERLKTLSPKLAKIERKYQQRLQVSVRKPSGLKIDKYLETHQMIRYNYDFGDNWWFTVHLEAVVHDYYFGFPTLLDGAETAPPEDVGGIHGYYTFLEALQDEEHPDYERMSNFSEFVDYREYDSEFINFMLKAIQYQKTQWDKIKHKNYVILEDKYRGKQESGT